MNPLSKKNCGRYTMSMWVRYRRSKIGTRLSWRLQGAARRDWGIAAKGGSECLRSGCSASKQIR
jgi:hypothetical protein